MVAMGYGLYNTHAGHGLWVILSGPLYPNALSALFRAFPRLASPTSSTYPVGCPSPT